MKLVTHNDRFHADDVFALAVLRIKFGNEIKEVIRTRDEEIIKSADIVFDVGGIYDAEKNRFDHHQPESAGERNNGFPYAAFGLVWKKWGEEICGSKEIAEIVDERLVIPIDAGDNGFSFYKYPEDSEISEYTMDKLVGAFGSTWKEEDNYDEAYFEMVDFAEKILRREIVLAQHKAEAIPIVEKAYQDSEDKRFVVFDKFLPWAGVISNYEEVLYVVFPSKNKKLWRASCVQESNFVNRKDFPKEWAGLRDEELEKVSGVKGAKFCHRKLFLAVGDSKESALQLVKIALDY